MRGIDPRWQAALAALVLFGLGALTGVAGDRLWLGRAPAAAEASTLTAQGMVTALHLDAAQEARVRAVLDSLHGDLARAAQGGTDSLVSAALQGRRRLEAALPPDRRQSFQAWMQQHHASMMEQMGGGMMGPRGGTGGDSATSPGGAHMQGRMPGMMRGEDSGTGMMPRRP